MISLIILGTTSVLITSVLLHFWRYLQRHSTSVPVPEHEILDLPDGWWSDQARFQLERRAIFSQMWICVSHRGRFSSPGDYVVYDVAGFRILMILGKDMVVRSFHNVCRHRAFPIARKQSGSATVLGCRYHGWSYNTEGKLTKAPYFDNLPGFDRSLNSLFEIHTEQDSGGFLHINVSRDKGVPAAAISAGLEKDKIEKVRIDSEFVGSFERSGKFNWKIILDQSYAIMYSTAVNPGSVVRSFPVEGPSSAGQLPFFPLTTVHTRPSQSFWYQLTYNPVAVDQTSLRCDIYAHSPQVSFKLDGSIKDSLEKEIQQKLLGFEHQYKQLITAKEKGFANGYQAKIAAAVEMHRRREALQGLEIKPASLKQQKGEANLSKAESICQAVDCGTSRKLDW